MLFISNDFLLLSNEKGIAALSALLLALYKFIIQKKINYVDIVIVITLSILAESMRSVILILLIIPLFIKKKNAVYIIILLTLICLMSYNHLLSKYYAFDNALENESANGRYASAAMAFDVFKNNIYYGFGFGEYHNLYREYYPNFMGDDIDYSGFNLAELYFELGYLTPLIYLILYLYFKFYYKYKNYLIFLILVIFSISSPTDKISFLTFPIILGLYNLIYEKENTTN